MRYRRSQAKGATFFFTIVTHNRKKIFCDEANIALIKEAFQSVINKYPFKIDAFVLLPDHIHYIWTLPENDNDFSVRWRLVKSYFSRRCPAEYKEPQSASRQSKGEQVFWQRRFWEHQIRDEADFISHVEYIHYNPVKHGLAGSPGAWPHSSFHRDVKQGAYDIGWGTDTIISFNMCVGIE